MRLALLIIVFLGQNYSIAQDQLYRFQFFVAGRSIMNYGLRSFENVQVVDNETYRIYSTEKYNVDYKNFTFSGGLNWKFSIDWLNNEKYALRQSISFFSDNYTEEVFLELTDIGNSELYYFTGNLDSSDVAVGNKSKAIFRGKSYGVSSEILFFKKFKSGVNVGLGINYGLRNRSDRLIYFNGYVPTTAWRGLPGNATSQFGVSFQVEKKLKRFKYFLNLNQACLTINKYRGVAGLESDQGLYPVSHNLNFRFPLTIQVGLSVAFDKIKKSDSQ